mgnify:FL=1
MKKLILISICATVTICGYLLVNDDFDLTSDEYKPINAKSVFKQKCIKCHSYLEKGDEYLIQMGYVKPKDPARSMIFRYLKGANVDGPENMPPKYDFTNVEVNLIRDWINSLNVRISSHKKVTVAAEDELSNREVFNRCSLQFTNLPSSLSAKHLVEDIDKKLITGSQACVQLLEQASLDEHGKLINNNKVTQAILLNFQKVHNNWFNEWNFFTSMSTWGTFEVLDPGSMGFFFTRSLFDKNHRIKSIFSGTDSYEGMRESQHQQKYLQYKFKEEPRYKIDDYRFIYGLSIDGEYKKWSPSRVSSGTLIGVKKIASGRDILPIIVNSKDNQEEIKPAIEIEVNKDIHKGLGGGILGSENYVNLNLGQELGKSMDGGKIIPRRWAKAVVKELLCRELPVIPVKRVRPFVQKSSSLSFRKKESCMGCHATMDNLAYLVRNVEQAYSADAGGDGMIHSTHLRYHQPSTYLEEEKTAPDSDTNFHMRPAYGRFVYQDIYGKYYNKKVKSLDELGSIISDMDDFYLCTAKKYLNYLTGVDVSMSIFSLNSLSYKEQYFKDLLEQSAQQMKKSGDLKDGMRTLIKSRVYNSRKFDVIKE